MKSNRGTIFSRTLPDDRVMARIRGADLIQQQLGCWPDFHDFEVISIALERAPWNNGITCDLRAVFYIFNNQRHESSPERKPAHAELLFHDIDQLRISGFNHQNPIIGLGLRLTICKRLRRELLSVQWGGTCMHHEVRFRCDSITVVRVMEIDPFLLQQGRSSQ